MNTLGLLIRAEEQAGELLTVKYIDPTLM